MSGHHSTAYPFRGRCSLDIPRQHKALSEPALGSEALLSPELKAGPAPGSEALSSPELKAEPAPGSEALLSPELKAEPVPVVSAAVL